MVPTCKWRLPSKAETLHVQRTLDIHQVLRAMSYSNWRVPQLVRETIRECPGSWILRRPAILDRRDAMNLLIWLPLMFVLGLISLLLCLLFVDACERI